MKNFCIDSKVFEVLPDYCIGLVVADGIDNRAPVAQIGSLLDENTQAFQQKAQGANIRELENVAAFRTAFQSLGMNPNKFSCSIEALLKRVQKGGQLPHINPIVDLGNALSVHYCLPMGAHDIEKLEGNLSVRFSVNGDHFQPLGQTDIEQMPEGELVYASASTVKTRRWVWRQSEDGKITENTRCVVFPIDGFQTVNEAQVLAARDDLAARLKELFGCPVTTGFVCRSTPVFTIAP